MKNQANKPYKLIIFNAIGIYWAGPDVTRLSKTLNTTPRAEVQAAAAANGQPAVQAVPAETPYTALVRALTDYFFSLKQRDVCNNIPRCRPAQG